MITTYLLDCSMLPDPLECEKELACLPKERAEKICRQKHPEARKQSFGAGLLLDYVLREAAGICGREVKIEYNSYGKPLAAQIPFNLSHSGRYVILSILSLAYAGKQEADGVFIGCDIEQVKKYNPKTARRFFTEAEYRSLEGIADKKAQAEQFFRYWTRKESVMKLTGLGMALPMDLFDVSRSGKVIVDKEKTAGRQAAVQEKENAIENEIGKEQAEYQQAASLLMHAPLYLKEYRRSGYCIAVCSTHNQFAPELLIKKACIGGHVMIN